MVKAERNQSPKPSLHYPDQVVGRHRIQHILIEERNHLARASFGVRVLPRQNADRLLLLLLFRLLRDRIDLDQLIFIFGGILARGWLRRRSRACFTLIDELLGTCFRVPGRCRRRRMLHLERLRSSALEEHKLLWRRAMLTRICRKRLRTSRN